MSGSKKQGEMPRSIQEFRQSTNPWISFTRDILWVVCVVGAIALVLYLASGTWPAVVAVESESMVPNLQVGDLVFVVEKDRFGELTTWVEGMETGYARFADEPDIHGNVPYGDVIIYRPNGDSSIHPIIHRAIAWVEDDIEHPGYITKGDNNMVADQDTYYTGIGRIEPVKEEWIVGKALFSIPLVGYLPLHLLEFALLIVVLMLIIEAYGRMREQNRKETKRPKRK
jgi:signal peptidase